MPKFGIIYKVFAVFLIAALAFLPTPASAQVQNLQQLKLDKAIIIEDESYSLPTQIVIVPLFPPETKVPIRDEDWYRGIFYYSIANSARPGFTDIPFHYTVSKTGEVYAGNSGGEERKINIAGIGESALVIGYLAGKSDNAFDPRSEEAMSTLVIDLCNRHSIPLDKIQIATVRYVRNDEAETVVIEREQVFGLWQTSLGNLVEKIRPFYTPIPKQYQVEIVNLSVTADPVQAGETVVGSLTLKNTGGFGIYPGTLTELLGTYAGSTSKFYLPEFWPSTSQFRLLSESGALLPGKEQEYGFRLNVPISVRPETENFSLKTVGGVAVSGTEFSITLNVQRPSGTIVEVGAPEFGWIRVRSAPYVESGEIARVSTGERFFVIDDTGTGWIKIRLPDGQEGWVVKQYMIYL